MHEAEGEKADEGSSRDALMDAALEQLAAKGVLAGLNLSEVGKAAGVTPANIYHFFGSRQGLLRAALAREARRFDDVVGASADDSFVERRLRMFDAIGSAPGLTLTALLALDGDPDYQPMPFIDATMHRYRSMVEAGELRDGIDLVAVHLVGLALSIGIAIYAEAAARQLDVDADEVRTRTRAVYEEMLAMVAAPPTEPGG